MSDTLEFVFICTLCFAFGMVITIDERDTIWQTEIVKHKCGEFNTTTAKFQWVNNA